ncbi:hypothetical protein KQI49_13240 [Virgibacillus sp. MSJ-26]|uniref:hypothetical protein n=1 Tax=Virgibacillus sp. MSJ-26 TaxID=2841522 RepID=UPI001C10A809|nr:hypothetical protein [Virgibacillus sp. MSJ-26]MBU5467787.1 hypothetical protein [Virgibacillus sp. MSJ-26]
MNDQAKTINQLIKKLNQHEQTITQLVEIIALTNRRLTDLAKLQSASSKEAPQNHTISPH